MDEVLAAIVRDAEADPNVVAAVLHRSRSVGQERSDSDYDAWRLRRPPWTAVARSFTTASPGRSATGSRGSSPSCAPRTWTAQLDLYEDVRTLMESRGVLTHRTWQAEQLA